MTCPACDDSVPGDTLMRLVDLCERHRDAAFQLDDAANECPANGVVQMKWGSRIEHGEA